MPKFIIEPSNTGTFIVREADTDRIIGTAETLDAAKAMAESGEFEIDYGDFTY